MLLNTQGRLSEVHERVRSCPNHHRYGLRRYDGGSNKDVALAIGKVDER